MTKMVEKSAQELQSTLYAKFFQGLANPTRYRIVEVLLGGSKNVSELVETLGVSQSLVSNQLACLKWCGYVSSQQEGKYVYYKITDERIRTIMELSRSVVTDNASHISSCTRM
ncbi:MAG: metalloregulator ArsR/SmtB family transcription factor [Firmicutes bacterium]|nr:metalloregulator ArsR/SmtB family transcription factor [Bacillota bacterium]